MKRLAEKAIDENRKQTTLSSVSLKNIQHAFAKTF
jgi:hypothetical protein